MVEKDVDVYWLDMAVRSFMDNVWLCGLQKFAGDSGDGKATLSFGVLSINVTPDSVLSCCIITLSDQTDEFSMSLNLEEERQPYQFISCSDTKSVTDMIEEICDTWTQGFFTLEDELK